MPVIPSTSQVNFGNTNENEDIQLFRNASQNKNSLLLTKKNEDENFQKFFEMFKIEKMEKFNKKNFLDETKQNNLILVKKQYYNKLITSFKDNLIKSKKSFFAISDFPDEK